MNKAKHHTLIKTAGKVAAGLGVALLLALNVVVVQFGESLDILVTSDKVDLPQESKDKEFEKGEALAEKIEAEGLVLLKNDDEALPLSSSTSKVNVFGWAQSDWIYGGSGSGGVQGDNTDLLSALKDAGIDYNSELSDVYANFATGRNKQKEGSLNSHDYEFLQLFEPFISDTNYFPEDLLDRAKNYSDTALVVLGRRTGESLDAMRNQWNVSKKGQAASEAENRSYLEISPAEEALLTYVAKNYQHTIVLINSTNTMNLGFLDDISGLDAAILCGTTGKVGTKAVVNTLLGKVNPSGKTTDTYAYDLKTAASWANSGADGEGVYTNADGLYPADGTKNTNVGSPEKYEHVRFVDYTEGIYVGYRWYETADTEGFWDAVKNTHGKGYSAVVQYPFGYGLSYTNFSWEIIDRTPQRGSNLLADGEIKLTVRVTNTGKRAGKDVVELYYSSPYIKGEIEKSAINLAAFKKTKLLEPGEQQDLILSFNVSDMASYDYNDANNNGFMGYELDPGDYQVLLMKDAHTLADCKNAKATYHLTKSLLYPKDPATGARVSNKFSGDGAEAGISIDGNNTGQNIRYLTRADFAGTFPYVRDADRMMPHAVQQLNSYTKEDAEAEDALLLDALADAGNYPVRSIKDIYGAARRPAYELLHEGRITNLGLELGENYDDPRWEQVLNQLSAQDMERLVLHGYSNTARLDSVAKPKNKDLDGPSQIGSFNQLRFGTAFPNAAVLAQTWNVDLAQAFGEQVGMEAAVLGVDGWYAPAANLHRSPLGGRNYEYYSEDPLLSGKMAACVVRGSLNTGTYVYMKHLLLNEQDSYRDGLYTWLDEQSLRELYLKPFRLAVIEGKATGMMSSYNRIGPVWAGGSNALLQGVLRDEWNFKGTVITDYSDHHAYMNVDEMLRAGGDLYMDGVFRDGAFRFNMESPAFAYRLRSASKDILYTWLNARAENINYNMHAADKGLSPLVRPIKLSGINPLLVGISLVDALVSLLLIVRLTKFVRAKRNRK